MKYIGFDGRVDPDSHTVRVELWEGAPIDVIHNVVRAEVQYVERAFTPLPAYLLPVNEFEKVTFHCGGRGGAHVYERPFRFTIEKDSE